MLRGIILRFLGVVASVLEMQTASSIWDIFNATFYSVFVPELLLSSLSNE
jgi:hypothetical protein